MTDLGSLLGQIDIYLFDQLLRGRIAPGMTVLDAGCGRGRNLLFFCGRGTTSRVSIRIRTPSATSGPSRTGSHPDFPRRISGPSRSRSNSFPDDAATS